MGQNAVLHRLAKKKSK